MAQEKSFASPPCLACEMDRAYAGYLTEAELAAALTRLLALAEGAPGIDAGRWRAALQPILARLPEPVPESPVRAETLEAFARMLPPRIADDRVHAAVKGLFAERA